MPRNFLLSICIGGAALLIGCSKIGTMSNNSRTNENSNKGTTAASTTPASKETGDKVGIPECDDFIAKYDACVANKVPEMMRAQYKSMVTEWRNSWKKLAADPSSKPTVVAACKQMAAQQAAALKAFGCTF
jgi:hypothetical protein